MRLNLISASSAEKIAKVAKGCQILSGILAGTGIIYTAINIFNLAKNGPVIDLSNPYKLHWEDFGKCVTPLLAGISIAQVTDYLYVWLHYHITEPIKFLVTSKDAYLQSNVRCLKKISANSLKKVEKVINILHYYPDITATTGVIWIYINVINVINSKGGFLRNDESRLRDFGAIIGMTVVVPIIITYGIQLGIQRLREWINANIRNFKPLLAGKGICIYSDPLEKLANNSLQLNHASEEELKAKKVKNSTYNKFDLTKIKDFIKDLGEGQEGEKLRGIKKHKDLCWLIKHAQNITDLVINANQLSLLEQIMSLSNCALKTLAIQFDSRCDWSYLLKILRSAKSKSIQTLKLVFMNKNDINFNEKDLKKIGNLIRYLRTLRCLEVRSPPYPSVVTFNTLHYLTAHLHKLNSLKTLNIAINTTGSILDKKIFPALTQLETFKWDFNFSPVISNKEMKAIMEGVKQMKALKRLQLNFFGSKDSMHYVEELATGLSALSDLPLQNIQLNFGLHKLTPNMFGKIKNMIETFKQMPLLKNLYLDFYKTNFSDLWLTELEPCLSNISLEGTLKLDFNGTEITPSILNAFTKKIATFPGIKKSMIYGTKQ